MHSQKGTEKMKTLRLQPLTVPTVCTICGAPETVHRNTLSGSDPHVWSPRSDPSPQDIDGLRDQADMLWCKSSPLTSLLKGK